MIKKTKNEAKTSVPVQKIFTTKISAMKDSIKSDKESKTKKHAININRPPPPKVASKSPKTEPIGMNKSDTSTIYKPKIREVTVNPHTNIYPSDFVLNSNNFDSMATSMQFDNSFADFNNQNFYNYNPNSSSNADSDFYTNPSFSDFSFTNNNNNNNRNKGYSSSSFNDQTHKRYHF